MNSVGSVNRESKTRQHLTNNMLQSLENPRKLDFYEMPSKQDRPSVQPQMPDQTPKQNNVDQMVRFTEENEEESEA